MRLLDKVSMVLEPAGYWGINSPPFGFRRRKSCGKRY
jgi:hypothetical protein